MALIGFLALVLGACAVGRGQADSPGPDAARQEIARLWGDIERMRGVEPEAERVADSLGDSDGDAEPSAMPDDGYEEAGEAEPADDSDDGHDDDSDMPSAAMERRAPAAAGSVRAEPKERSGRSRRYRPRKARLVCEDGTRPEVSACRDSCTIAQSICDNAVNICRLANELADDEWARGKCNDASVACIEATEACCDCG